MDLPDDPMKGTIIARLRQLYPIGREVIVWGQLAPLSDMEEPAIAVVTEVKDYYYFGATSYGLIVNQVVGDRRLVIPSNGLVPYETVYALNVGFRGTILQVPSVPQMEIEPVLEKNPLPLYVGIDVKTCAVMVAQMSALEVLSYHMKPDFHFVTNGVWDSSTVSKDYAARCLTEDDPPMPVMMRASLGAGDFHEVIAMKVPPEQYDYIIYNVAERPVHAGGIVSVVKKLKELSASSVMFNDTTSHLGYGIVRLLRGKNASFTTLPPERVNANKDCFARWVVRINTARPRGIIPETYQDIYDLNQFAEDEANNEHS